MLKFFKKIRFNYLRYPVTYIFLFISVLLVFAKDYLKHLYLQGTPQNHSADFNLMVFLFSAIAAAFVSVVVYLAKEHRVVLSGKKLDRSTSLLDFVIALLIGGLVYGYAHASQIVLYQLSTGFVLHYLTFLGLLVLLGILLPIISTPKRFNKAGYLVVLGLKALATAVLSVIVIILTSIIISFTVLVLDVDTIGHFGTSIVYLFFVLLVVPSLLDIFPKRNEEYVQIREIYKIVISILAKTFMFFWLVFSVLQYLYTIKFFIDPYTKSIAVYSLLYLLLSAVVFLLLNTGKVNVKTNLAVLLISVVQAFVMLYAVFYRVASYGLTVNRAYVIFFGALYIILTLLFLQKILKRKSFDFKVALFVIIGMFIAFTYFPRVNLVDLAFSNLAKTFSTRDLEDQTDILATFVRYKGYDYTLNVLGEERYRKFKLGKLKAQGIVPSRFDLSNAAALTNQEFEDYLKRREEITAPQPNDTYQRCTLYIDKEYSNTLPSFNLDLYDGYKHFKVCSIYTMYASRSTCENISYFYDSGAKALRIIMDDKTIGAIPLKDFVENILADYETIIEGRYGRIHGGVDTLKCSNYDELQVYYKKTFGKDFHTDGKYVYVIVTTAKLLIRLPEKGGKVLRVSDIIENTEDVKVNLDFYIFY